MHNTKFEAIRHIILGLILAAVGVFFNFVKFQFTYLTPFLKNLKAVGYAEAIKKNALFVKASAKTAKTAVMVFGAHFSVLGFSLVFAGAVLFILGIIGFFVFADEKKKNAVAR